ncbi:MAG: dehydratase [Oscillospiraceae bacterium]|nr:dehydratase [Oscillospiraceae bacterium]
MNTYRFSDLSVGHSERFRFSLDEGKLEAFCALSGDCNPLHCDRDYARAAGFPEKVVYGQLTAAALSTLAGMYLPGKYSIIHSIETEFRKPVFLSKCPLEVVGTVREMDERFQTMILQAEIFDTDGQKVCKAKMRVGFLTKEAAE